MNSKGQIWVSAILYLALGIIIIGVILGVALPTVNKMRDRNTYIQTKDMMVGLNKNIVDVINEGPGSKRYISPLTVEKGELYVAPEKESRVQWKFKTKNKLVEPEMVFSEGDLTFSLNKTVVADEYEFNFYLIYTNAEIVMSEEAGALKNPFVGTYSMVIENSGYGASNKPTITITMNG